ncbi:MAG: transporter substrate-binding domain-containing protein [Venatoribacter sp.]
MRLVILLVIYWISPFTYAAERCHQLQVSGTVEYPPFMWQSQQSKQSMDGALIELMSYLSAQSHIQLQVNYTGAWARTQAEMKIGSLDALAGIFYNEERARTMVFLEPPVAQSNARIWVKKGKNTSISSLEQLDKLQGATVIGFSLGQTFDEYAASHHNIARVRSIKQAFQMLDAGRIDFVAYEEQPGIAILNIMEIVPEHLEMLPYLISSEDVYLALAKNSPCNTAEVKQQLQELLVKAKESNVIDAMLERAQQRWVESNQ